MKITFDSPIVLALVNDLHLKLFANKILLDEKLADKNFCFQ